MKITSSKESTNSLKLLVYSQSGIGKTRLIATCPEPIIISSEKKLVSISGDDFPEFKVLEVKSYEDTQKALKWIKKHKSDYKTICVDSATNIAEKLLVGYIKEGMSKREYYGILAEEMTEFLNDLLEIDDMHIYVICKAKRFLTAEGDEKFHPSMPGQVLPLNMPYMFDEVFAMRIGKDEDGEKYRYLQTQPSENYEAKDSSDKLNEIERPDLGFIIDKISSKKPKQKKKKGKGAKNGKSEE